MLVLSPKRLPFQDFCSQIKRKVAICNWATYQREPCFQITFDFATMLDDHHYGCYSLIVRRSRIPQIAHLIIIIL